MTVANYLTNKLKTCSHYSLTPADKQLLKDQGIEAYIYNKLTLKKFRKWSLPPATQTKIKQVIKLHVSQNKPLLFTFPFGGYKLWRLPTAPEVDWAEFLMLAYYLNYLSPIVTAYKPGVEFYFSSDEIIIKRMDNISKKDTDQYTQSFLTLLSIFKEYFPKNLEVNLVFVRDLYSSKEFEQELAERIEETKKNWLKEKDQNKRQSYLKMSELNIKFKGVQNWSKLSEKKQKEKIEMGPIYHDAYIQLKHRVKFVKGKDKIIIFPFSIPNTACVPIGSTRASTVKFWTGFGILEKTSDSFIDRILSPQQLNQVKNQFHKVVKSTLIPLKNFQQIWVYPTRLNFSKS